MEYIAESKNVKISPRKVRLVVDAIRKLQLADATRKLEIINKRAATPIKKTLESAIANAVNNFKVKKEDLTIREILINEGITYKRFHYGGRGRIKPYKKRSSHIKVILEAKNEQKKTDVKEGKEETLKSKK